MWVYPPLEYMMVEEGLQEVETYIFRCLNMVAQFIATRTIMDLCLVVERRPGPRVSNRRWKQDGVYVEGMRTAVWDA